MEEHKIRKRKMSRCKVEMRWTMWKEKEEPLFCVALQILFSP